MLEREPEPPRKLNPKADRDLETICLKCLDKEPQRRYGSAEAMAEDLERWLEGRPIRARPVGSLERTAKWVRRNPILAGLLGLVLMVSVAAAALVTWKWREASALATSEATQREKAETAAEEKERQREAAEAARGREAEQREQAERAQDEAERALYYSRMTLAHAEYDRGNITQMEELLDSCPPKRIGWEWHFLQRLMRQDVVTLPCGGWAHAWMAWSPDKRYLATSMSNNRGVQLWDAGTFRPVKSFTSIMAIVGVAFSPDGKQVIGGGPEGRLRVWNAATLEPELALEGHTATIAQVVFAPDGKTLATCGFDGRLILWDPVNWKPLKTVEAGGRLHALAFSRDGKRLATGDLDGRLTVWDAETWQPVLVERSPHLQVARSVAGIWSGCLEFSHDGSELFSGDASGAVRRWPLPHSR